MLWWSAAAPAMTRWRMKLVYVVLTCLQVTLRVSEAASQRVIRLEPVKILHSQVLHHKETVVFHLMNLKPGSHYELRISYPATTPTNFFIKLMDHTLSPVRNGRRLMNIEKIMFTTEHHVTEKFVEVTAARTGVPKDPKRLRDPVKYNIVLEELHFGLTGQVWKMGLLVVAIVIFVIKFTSPRVLGLIEVELTQRQKQEN